MSIAPWLLPVLWREHDWRAALERLATQQAGIDDSPQAQRAAFELARAAEYIEPDRRRAIAIYELAGPRGDLGRARELAVELGWWSARARLSVAARAVDPDPRLVLEEAEAWWDAGQPDLCALALSGLRSSDRSAHALELAALVGAGDLVAHAATAGARGASLTGSEAADAYVMAARYSRAAGGMEAVITGFLEAALVAQPGHQVSASLLLALACNSRDPERIQRYLRLRLEGVDATAWIDGMRASALALINTDHHRGFGLRLLRQALERAYESRHLNIPGHLAMWTVLAAHASADGSRRDLLPLVIIAIQSSDRDVDRVWLGALATEISLRDAKHAVVAGAYAEIVAEYAPEHPIVRELVAAVAEPEPTEVSVPPAAISAAAAKLEETFDVEIDLDDAYAGAAEASLLDTDLEELGDESPVATPPPVAPLRSIAPAAPATPRIAHPKPSLTSIPNAVVAAPKADATVTPPAATSTPKVVPAAKPSIAPASIAKPAALATPASIVPASIVKPSSIIPSSISNRAPTQNIAAIAKPAAMTTPFNTQPISRLEPPARSMNPPSSGVSTVLAALRTVDRPVIPPRAPDPSDASPRARRIAIPIDVRLILSNEIRIDGHSRDISTSGLFVLTDASLTVGETLTVELLLPGKEAFTEDEYRSRARIARRAEGGYGIELLAPDAALIAALGAL